MSRFRKLSQGLWHCQYHIVWTPKYRFRMLDGLVGEEVHNCIQVFCGRLGCEVVELNIQKEPIHLIVMVPPKVSISRPSRRQAPSMSSNRSRRRRCYRRYAGRRR